MNKNIFFRMFSNVTPVIFSHHLANVEVEQLHDETVWAPVVDVGGALDQVVLRRAESVQDVPLPL